MRTAILLGALVCMPSFGTTLEKLSVEEMAVRSTEIVRGRVQTCVAETRLSRIYTRCSVAVSERWKGSSTAAQLSVLNPGGVSRGLRQTFSGAPKLTPGEDYVLFLWAGKSGQLQLIGMSQGVFDIRLDLKGAASAKRDPISAQLVDDHGRAATDQGFEMSLDQLKSRVARALAGGAK